MVKILATDTTTVQVGAAVLPLNEEEEENKQLWKGRKVQKICFGAAAVEAIVAVVILIPALVYNHTPTIIAGTCFGVASFTTVIGTLNCNTSADGDEIIA